MGSRCRGACLLHALAWGIQGVWSANFSAQGLKLQFQFGSTATVSQAAAGACGQTDAAVHHASFEDIASAKKDEKSTMYSDACFVGFSAHAADSAVFMRSNQHSSGVLAWSNATSDVKKITMVTASTGCAGSPAPTLTFGNVIQFDTNCDGLYEEETGALPTDCAEYPAIGSATGPRPGNSASTVVAGVYAQCALKNMHATPVAGVGNDVDGAPTNPAAITGEHAALFTKLLRVENCLHNTGACTTAIERVGGYRLDLSLKSTDTSLGTSTARGAGEAAQGVTNTGSSLCSVLSQIGTGATYSTTPSWMAATNVGQQIAACYAGAFTTNATAVELNFTTNAHRARFYQYVTEASLKTALLDASTATDLKIASVESATLKNAVGQGPETPVQSLTLVCDAWTGAGTYHTNEANLKTELGSLVWKMNGWHSWTATNAEAANVEVEMVFLLDEEIFRVARYLARTADLTSKKCARWKPSKIACANCGLAADGTTEAIISSHAQSDLSKLEFTWEITRANLNPWADPSSLGATQFGGANTICGYIDSQLTDKKMTYCKPHKLTNASKRERATIGFLTVKHADEMRVLGALSGVQDPAASGTYVYAKPEATNMAQMTFTVTANSAATASEVPAAPFGSDAKPSNSACAVYAGSTNTVYCESVSKGAGTMTMYFAGAWSRQQQAHATMNTPANANVYYATPTAVTPGRLRTVTFKTTDVDGATKASKDWATLTVPASGAVKYNPPSAPDSGCNKAATALSSNHMVYCQSTATAAEIMWIGDDAPTSETDTTKSDSLALANIRTLVGVQGGDAPTPGFIQHFVWKDSSSLYTTTYSLTKKAKSGDTTYTIKPNFGNEINTADSGCKYAAQSSVVFCTSTASAMTIGWLYAHQRQTDAFAIAAKGEEDPITAVKPTAAKDLGKATTQFTNVTWVAKNSTAGTAWTKASGGTVNLADTACGEHAFTLAIYCESTVNSGTDMILTFLSHAAARDELRALYGKKTGEGETELKPFATPKANTLYTADFSLGKKTAAEDATPEPIEAKDGCKNIWIVSTKAASCTGSASSITLYYLTEADRLLDAPEVGRRKDMGTVGTFSFSGAKDLAKANPVLTVVYEVQADAEATFKATGKHMMAADSACVGAGPPAKAVKCNNAKGSKGGKVDMELKYLGESDPAVTPAYIAPLKVLADAADVGSGDTAKRMYTLKSADPEAIDAVVTIKATTTKAPTSRRLVAGDKASAGSFTASDSWCAEVATSSNVKSAIYCQSTKDGKMTLTYLNNDLANVDVAKLSKLTTYVVAHETAHKITLETSVSADTAEDALCTQTFITAEMAGWATCSHAAVAMADSRRRLATAKPVSIVLTFNTAASLTKAQTAFDSIDWATVTDVTKPTVSVEGGHPTSPEGPTPVAGTPTTGGGKTPATKKPSGTSLRLVGFAFLAIFAAA